MRTNILRSVSLALGICVCGTVQAQYGGYGSAPAQQNAQYQHGQFAAPAVAQPTYVNQGQVAVQQPQPSSHPQY